jgi:hypothetical protein
MDRHCYACGREVTEPRGAVAVIVVESHSGRVGSARLHGDCCCQPSLVRYRQTVEWDGSTLGNLSAFKRLHGRLAAANGSASGSVPILLA